MANTIGNKSVGERLRRLRGYIGFSQQDFADLLGISLRAYQNYERGERKIPADLVVKLSNSGVSPGWLLYGLNELMNVQDRLLSDGTNISSRDLDVFGRVEIRLHPDQLLGGNCVQAQDESNKTDCHDIKYIMASIGIESKIVRDVLNADPGNVYLVYIDDNAMSPTLRRNDMVIVDTGSTQVVGDSIFVIKIDGLLSVRRLQARPGGVVHVISDNPSFPSFDAHLGDHRDVMKKDTETISVVGKVIWKGCIL